MVKRALSGLACLALVTAPACNTMSRRLEARDTVPAAGAHPGAPSTQIHALREDPGNPASSVVRHAVAVLEPTQQSKVRGTIDFVQEDGDVTVRASVRGLEPGKHAFHVHLWGDCSSQDAKSAGTHFNFAGSSESPPPDIDRITGNLGELEADASGNAESTSKIDKATLTGAYSIVGRSVIIHEKGNDESAPPIGAAGGRLACGVIGIKQG